MSEAMRDREWDFHSDEDGDRFLHSEDPAGAAWKVEVVGRSLGDDSHRAQAPRFERSVGFPALNWEIPLNAWLVGRDYCHVELTDEHGVLHILDICPHNPGQ